MRAGRLLLIAAVNVTTACSSPGSSRRLATTSAAIRVQGRVVPDDLVLGEDAREAAWAGIGPAQAGAEVVFAGVAGEVSAIAKSDGSYDLRLAPGSYRVFVRGDRVASAASVPAIEPPYARPVPGPRPELALRVELARDTVGLDMPAIEVARVSGRVVDPAGRPIAGAIVREHEPGMVVVSGGGAAVTDADGRYRLHVVPGHAVLEVDHPDFARTMLDGLELSAGVAHEPDIPLHVGCTVTGRVFAPDGRPVGPGAIVRKGVKETGEPSRRQRFFRAGAIASDGSFRWSTTDTGPVLLAAWPESAAMSPPQRFACRDGARFDGVVFRVPATLPDTIGVVVRRDGTPAASVRVVARPSGWGGMRQFASTDSAGRFAMSGLPVGNYQVTVMTPVDGSAVADITLPARDVRLVLSGTTRIEGSAPRLDEGAFLLRTEEPFGKPAMQILVPVHRGRFAVERLPANFSAFRWLWQQNRGWVEVDLDSGRPLVLPVLGPLVAKRATGVVRFRGKPVGGAVITVERRPGALFAWRTVEADAAGGFALDTFAGAELQVRAPLDGRAIEVEGGAELWGHARVGSGPGREDRLDIDVEPFYDD